MALKTTTKRRERTPEQQVAYERLDQAWKVAARAVAADMPFHIPVHLVRKALAANAHELAAMEVARQEYRAAMLVQKDPDPHTIMATDPWAGHTRSCRARATDKLINCTCAADREQEQA